MFGLLKSWWKKRSRLKQGKAIEIVVSEASETPTHGSESLSQLASGTVSGISSPSISLSLERSLALRSEFYALKYRNNGC